MICSLGFLQRLCFWNCQQFFPEQISILEFLKKVVMGNAPGGLEQDEGQETKGSTGGINPTPSLTKKKSAPPKLPMPPEEELEERFNVVLVSLLYTAMKTYKTVTLFH